MKILTPVFLTFDLILYPKTKDKVGFGSSNCCNGELKAIFGSETKTRDTYNDFSIRNFVLGNGWKTVNSPCYVVVITVVSQRSAGHISHIGSTCNKTTKYWKSDRNTQIHCVSDTVVTYYYEKSVFYMCSQVSKKNPILLSISFFDTTLPYFFVTHLSRERWVILYKVKRTHVEHGSIIALTTPISCTRKNSTIASRF